MASAAGGGASGTAAGAKADAGAGPATGALTGIGVAVTVNRGDSPEVDGFGTAGGSMFAPAAPRPPSPPGGVPGSAGTVVVVFFFAFFGPVVVGVVVFAGLVDGGAEVGVDVGVVGAFVVDGVAGLVVAVGSGFVAVGFGFVVAGRLVVGTVVAEAG